MVEFTTNDGLRTEGRVIRLNPLSVVFECCGPESVLRSSDVLQDFQISGESRVIFRGKATVRSLVNDGARTVCEAALDGGYCELDLNLLLAPRRFVQEGFYGFLKTRAKNGRINDDYRQAVGEMRGLLHDLNRWANQLEIAARANPAKDNQRVEWELVDELAKQASSSLAAAYEQFEIAASRVAPEHLLAHYAFCRRELHPFLLASPFMFRIFSKPLGYAGDYEMVSMILRNPQEGSSLFGRLLNVFILDQAPARAHRNRVAHLYDCLVSESARCARHNRNCRVYNIGCGPAGEVQRFMADHPLSNRSDITLLDGNEETVQYARNVLETTAHERARSTRLSFVKRTVQQLIKSGSSVEKNGPPYDFIYSAGLFDYLNDRVCRVLIEQCYSLLSPGGLLLVTNVDSCNPIKNIMEHIYEWFLIYRSGTQLQDLASGLPPTAERTLHAESTSSNLFLELRKPLTGP